MLSQTLGVFCLNVHMFCICVATNVTCVLLKCLLILHLCRHNRIVGSVSTLVCFAFVLSQTYLVFCLNICMFCICVVKNVPCILIKLLHVAHLCCLKRIMGSVCLFTCFAFVLSQTFNVFCLIVCISCICVVTNVPYVFVSSQLSCGSGLYVLRHLCCHKHVVCSV